MLHLPLQTRKPRSITFQLHLKHLDLRIFASQQLLLLRTERPCLLLCCCCLLLRAGRLLSSCGLNLSCMRRFSMTTNVLHMPTPGAEAAAAALLLCNLLRAQEDP